MNNDEYYLELHKNAFVIDTHCDTLKCLSSDFTSLRQSMWIDRSKKGLGKRSEYGHIDLPRLNEGGINCQTFAISSVRSRTPPFALRTAMQQLDIFYSECTKNEDKIMPARCHDDIMSAIGKRKVAALLSIEGADVIEGDLSMIRIFYRLGVRMVGLVHSRRNLIADGVADLRTGGGLSSFGVEVVEELDRLGVVIDISHLNDEGFWDLMDITASPVIASHSSCRAICDHQRNLTDQQINTLAERNSVIGINFAPSFIHPSYATVERVVDHIDHIVELVGPDHIGLGSDFDGISSTPVGLEDVSKMPNITRELIKREYPEEDIRKILGENHLRLFIHIIG
jgi:membrane dipeptidase